MGECLDRPNRNGAYAFRRNPFAADRSAGLARADALFEGRNDAFDRKPQAPSRALAVPLCLVQWPCRTGLYTRRSVERFDRGLRSVFRAAVGSALYRRDATNDDAGEAGG